MSKERWRDIDGFENYRVSFEGRVRNKRTGRVLRPAPDSSGYMAHAYSHGLNHWVGYNETPYSNCRDRRSV